MQAASSHAEAAKEPTALILSKFMKYGVPTNVPVIV